MQFPINLFLAGTVVIFAWILNLSTICAMRYLHSNTKIIYGFLSSLCVANLFMATIDFPPSIISNVVVSKSLQHVFCVSWTYLDTLLCNVAILHLLGSSLDSYLRLNHQSRYMTSTKHVLTCMKLSAPWTLSFVQSTAFMAISQMSDSTIVDDICVIGDPNLLILRSIMCFGVPISVSALLIFLSAKSLTHNEQPQKDSQNMTHKNPSSPDAECQYESFQFFPICRPPQLTRDNTEETVAQSSVADDSNVALSAKAIDVNNLLNYYQHQCPRHGVLALPLTQGMPLYDLSSTSRDPISTQHCPDLIPLQPSAEDFNQLKLSTITDSFTHHVNMANSHAGCVPTHQVDKVTKSLDHAYSQGTVIKESHERTAVAINLAVCIFTILLWGPFIIGSLIQGVCKPPYCLLPVSNARLNDFKWVSYTLCIVYPILFIIIDPNIRIVIKSSISC